MMEPQTSDSIGLKQPVFYLETEEELCLQSLGTRVSQGPTNQL